MRDDVSEVDMKRKDPDMGEEEDDEDSGDGSASSGSESPDVKRPRTSQFSAGLTSGPGDADGDTAESQLEAMLAAEATGLPPGMPNMPGMGAGAPLGGAGIQLPGEPKVVQTTPMDFSKLTANLPSQDVPVPKELVVHLMTPEHRSLLSEESGADVEWAPEEAQVKLRGSQEQIKKAIRLLNRVWMHCRWGRSEAKVRRLLRGDVIESAICRLSPMNTLRSAQKTLNTAQPIMTIGKDKTCDVVIQDQVISRQHCVLELDPERGAVYAIDTSTNGTFLNGVRLPSKVVGKVLVSHGDELLLKDPAGGDGEFGYIVNLQELQVRRHVKLQAPKRLMAPEDMTTNGRDFA